MSRQDPMEGAPIDRDVATAAAEAIVSMPSMLKPMSGEIMTDGLIKVTISYGSKYRLSTTDDPLSVAEWLERQAARVRRLGEITQPNPLSDGDLFL